MTTLNLAETRALCNGVYERDSMLMGAGIRSFTAIRDFIHCFCESEEAFREYKDFRIQAYKRSIQANRESDEWEQRFANDWEARGRRGDNPWNYSPKIYFDERFLKMIHTNRNALEGVRRPFDEERERLWQEEITRFTSGGAGQIIERIERQSETRAEICRCMFRSGAISLGFMPDNDIVVESVDVLSKNVANAYKLCLILDLKQSDGLWDARGLRVAVPSMGEAEPVKDLGRRFTTYFGLFRSSAERYDEIVATIRYEYLFPIEYGYQFFRNLRECKTLCQIYLVMCKLIQPELEEALIKDLT